MRLRTMGQKKITIRISKEDLPKARQRWARKPATQVTESRKAYDRQRAKSNARKAIKNGT